MASLLLGTSTPTGAGAEPAVLVASCVISPALTVDARKRQQSAKAGAAGVVNGGGGGGAGAEDEEVSEAAMARILSSPAAMPFAPGLLDARLQKVGRDSVRPVDIDNTIDGLRNYLSALNIRNKCKHPLFLVLRFDACIGLLYDSTRVVNPADAPDDTPFYQMMGAVARQRSMPSKSAANGGVVGGSSGGAPRALDAAPAAAREPPRRRRRGGHRRLPRPR